MSRSEKTSVAFRVGFISSVNPEKHTAKVILPDLGEDVVSHELQILRRRSRGDREYWMFDEREEVWCVFFGHGLEDGIILGATYSDEDELPVTDPDKHHIAYKDGTWFEYDRAENKWTIHVEGEIDVYAKEDITIKTDANVRVEAKGAVDVVAEKDVTIKTNANAAVAADGDIELNARNIRLKASGNIDINAGGGIKGTAAGIDWN